HAHCNLWPLTVVVPKRIVRPHHVEVGAILLVSELQRSFGGFDPVAELLQVEALCQGLGAQLRGVRQLTVYLNGLGRWRQSSIGRKVQKGIDACDGNLSLPL